MAKRYDVVVIGAGAAGTGAARRLVEAGLSVVVIEALPRAGGRAWTRAAAGMTLDLGCGWLHSADRNPWTSLAIAHGFAVDRREAAWGRQYHDLGFPADQRADARDTFARWAERIATTPPASDRAADAIEAGSRWTPYLQAMSGFISGDGLERISATDYAAYDAASTDENWRVPAGYGNLVTASLPGTAAVHLATPVTAISLDGPGVTLALPSGTVQARAAIVTISTAALSGDAIRWPSALDPWREAARLLPLGDNEKIFLEIIDGDGPFAPESHLLGDPHDATTGSYYVRPFGWPVIECFLGGDGARRAGVEGRDAASARAIEQLVGLFGAAARRHLRPLIASDWAATPSIGGAYSHALPGHAVARHTLARPFEDRLFFAGEATHATDFSTAHGAYASGARAAGEVIEALRPGGS
ncbi:flavin monoamine oxidase family protein [Sphingomonas abietis]|uniref:Tryptophan 2-monooxygenase n=1 Tax=Sphingomonas abietis TaxID=3012344 RepID=A0ABY7NT76_9SPHN|nr:NAD(P)/FAD-dependent oxidoreductase [Sphingomonas abietis]WBO24000.1 NAD(P)/FAD-dependent oxidoreductase [Sphingomonas abietis]